MVSIASSSVLLFLETMANLILTETHSFAGNQGHENPSGEYIKAWLSCEELLSYYI